MILGIGVDIVQNQRIRRIYGRWGDRILKRILHPREIEFVKGFRDPVPHIGVRFAAKEAFYKALPFKPPPGWWREGRVSVDEDGRPTFEVMGDLEKRCVYAGIKRILLSLSHERKYGIACVVIEG